MLHTHLHTYTHTFIVTHTVRHTVSNVAQRNTCVAGSLTETLGVVCTYTVGNCNCNCTHDIILT